MVRQGNQNPKTWIYTYVTENTFDAYLYQTLMVKARFIGQIMTSKSPAREMEDMDDVTMNFATIMSVTAGSPELREKLTLDTEVAMLRDLRATWTKHRQRLEDRVHTELPAEIAETEQLLTAFAKDIETAKKNCPPQNGFAPITIGEKTYVERKTAGEALLDAIAGVKDSTGRVIGTFRGFNLVVSYDYRRMSFEVNVKGEADHYADLGRNGLGNITRIENLIDKLEEKRTEIEQNLHNKKEDLERAKEEIQKPFEREEEYQKKTERLTELNLKLALDQSRDSVAETEDEAAVDGDDDIASESDTMPAVELSRSESDTGPVDVILMPDSSQEQSKKAISV